VTTEAVSPEQTTTTPGFLDDIDLDMSPEDELELVKKLEAEQAEQAETTEETTNETTSTKGTTEEVSAQTSTQEEGLLGQKPPAEDNTLAELRAERERLQQQLNELSISSLADRRRLESIEQSLLKQYQPQPEPEPEGPSPEQIAALLDQRIAQTDAALARAEAEDPTAAPALRQQLRQLERHYNNFLANQTLQQLRGPDPQEVIQQAVKETNTVNQFNAVRGDILQEFPVLDTQSEYFNQALRDEIHEIYNPMLAKGMDPTEALIKATTLVTRAHNVLPMSTLIRQHQEAEAAKMTEAEAAKTKAEIDANQRKTEQVKKNIEASQATPPNIASLGASNESQGVLGKYNFEKMSLSEFSKIPESELELIESTLAMYG
jgi:hypothetical protein